MIGRIALALAALLAAVPLPTAAWSVDASAPPEDLASFHRAFALAAYATPRHAATPLGWSGFDLWVDASLTPDFDDEPFAAAAIAGSLTGGHLAIARVGARKGLPGGFDVGLSYGQALEGDLELLSGELQWSWLDGSAATPAVAVRATLTEGRGDDAYDLTQYGVDALVSKGFTLLTPYAGAGVVRSDGEFRRPAGRLSVGTTQEIFYAGVVLEMLLPRVTIELQQADTLQAAVRVSVGL